jgi:SRSO17 transposase
MDRRWQNRLDEMRDDAVVSRSMMHDVRLRLEAFAEPFVATMKFAEQRINGMQYVEGLLSDLASKDAESIAYLHDRERQGMQKFIGQSEWDYRPLLSELVRQVATEVGEADGVLVFDPSSFPKKGNESVGVQRQWCGRLGKLENCQVGVYMGYVSRHEHALVDFRLYLPKVAAYCMRAAMHGLRLGQFDLIRDVWE